MVSPWLEHWAMIRLLEAKEREKGGGGGLRIEWSVNGPC